MKVVALIFGKHIRRIIFQVILIFPVVAPAQVLKFDSTVHATRSTVNTFLENIRYEKEVSKIYFESLYQGDSVLNNHRLRYSIIMNKKVNAAKSSRYLTEFSIDTTGSATYYFPFNTRGNTRFVYFRNQANFVQWSKYAKDVTSNSKKHPLITIHGNAYYEFLYRSRIDTPFAANGFRQHIEQVYADAIYKGKYPFRIYLNARQSNSRFFKNYINLNLRFNAFDFKQNTKDLVLKDLESRINAADVMNELASLLAGQVTQYDSLKRWLDHPARIQEIVEEKEQQFIVYSKLKTAKEDLESHIRSLTQFNDKSAWREWIETKGRSIAAKSRERILDSLEKQYEKTLGDNQKLEQKSDTLKDLVHKDSLMAGIGSLKNQEKIKDLRQALTKNLIVAHKQKRKIDSLQETIVNITTIQNKWKEAIIDSLQKLSAEKEGLANSLIGTTTQSEKRLAEKRKELDEMSRGMQKARAYYDSLKAAKASELGEIRNKLIKANSVKEINDIIKSKNGKLLDKNSAALLGIQQLGIGRSVVNYSELTVKNISMTGVNMEYEGGFYAALAIGQVDYRFRDFIINPVNKTRQNLVLARYGWLAGNNKSVILTAYTGTKQNYISADPQQPSFERTSMHIAGYGLEFKYRLNRNTDFTGEVVKSSVPYRGLASREAMSKAFAFAERNNEAWSLKMNVAIPGTQSSVKAFYRKVGVNFQSFSIFTTGSRQASWGVRWQQYVWKKHLSITGQIRKNDFDNPLISRNYSSTSTLKSLQGVFRKRKWPLVTIAYMPSTQLMKSQEGILTENIFYAFNTSVSQSFKTRRSMMNSTVFYNRFYTKGTDSGFVFFGAKSVRVNHDIQIGKTGSHSALDYYIQPGLSYYTISQNVDVQATPFFSVGLGAKRGLVVGSESLWGGSAQVNLNIKKAGSIQLQYEKAFLPDYTNTGLTANDWGRIALIKTF